MGQDPEQTMSTEQYVSALERARELLEQVRNVGETGDWDDLYTVVDFLTYAFNRANPDSPCKAGCSHCCEEMLFRVSDVEWRAIERHLERTLAPEALERLQVLVEEAYGPFREQLEALAAWWSAPERGPSPSEGLNPRCLFLDDAGCCGIYPVRPLVCRTYGQFGVWVDDSPTMQICQAHGESFIDLMTDQGKKPLVLPQFEPLYQRLRELAKTPVIAPLPLWILRSRS